ncbi:unnamed protein product [Cylicostephanus goldi]|uniref:Uncharacterized protein n=1 Tax=Cylicostephanus goldi TaxID=71465 RepID=A0A3P7LYJ0_CYLGO|nr:unnamed protein product [Cylicostephanus goldi]
MGRFTHSGVTTEPFAGTIILFDLIISSPAAVHQEILKDKVHAVRDGLLAHLHQEILKDESHNVCDAPLAHVTQES